MTTITEILEDPTGDLYTLLAVVGTTVTATILLTDGTTTTASCTIVDAPTGEVSFTEPALYGEITGWLVEGADGTVYESLGEHYADEDGIKAIVMDDDVVENLLERALIYADNKIERKLTTEEIERFPELEDTANLYAAVFITDAVYKDQDNRSPTARAWETEANEAIDAFLLKPGEEEDSETPYIARLI
jgi:hypothetical protein